MARRYKPKVTFGHKRRNDGCVVRIDGEDVGRIDYVCGNDRFGEEAYYEADRELRRELGDCFIGRRRWSTLDELRDRVKAVVKDAGTALEMFSWTWAEHGEWEAAHDRLLAALDAADRRKALAALGAMESMERRLTAADRAACEELWDRETVRSQVAALR